MLGQTCRARSCPVQKQLGKDRTNHVNTIRDNVMRPAIHFPAYTLQLEHEMSRYVLVSYACTDGRFVLLCLGVVLSLVLLPCHSHSSEPNPLPHEKTHGELIRSETPNSLVDADVPIPTRSPLSGVELVVGSQVGPDNQFQLLERIYVIQEPLERGLTQYRSGPSSPSATGYPPGSAVMCENATESLKAPFSD